MSVASAKGLVMLIVMNIASCQRPKVKCSNATIKMQRVIFLGLLPVVRCLKVKNNIFGFWAKFHCFNLLIARFQLPVQRV